MDNELIKRYAYAVAQKLPEAQRADIEKELQGLVEDMLEERTQGREATGEDVEAVLRELGNPGDMADRYRGSQRCLIGPVLFPTYLTVLKIVMGALGIAMLVVFLIQTLSAPDQIIAHFGDSLSTLLMGWLQAFAWVTIIFGVFDYTGGQKIRKELETIREWNPTDLPQLPDTQNHIPRSDPIASIIFTVLFIVLFSFSIHLFGLWVFSEHSGTIVIPFFNLEVFQRFLPFIVALMVAGILVEVGKLLTGKWTLQLLALDSLVHILNFILAIVMFSGMAIWNPQFLQQLAGSGMAPLGSETLNALSGVWNFITQNVIYLIGFGFAIQIIATAVKAVKIFNPGWINRASISSQN